MNTQKKQHRLSCHNCLVKEQCFLTNLSDDQIDQFEAIVVRERPKDKKETLYQAGDNFTNLYALRSGAVKSYRLDNNGVQLISGFYFSGDILGLNSIYTGSYDTQVEMLTTTQICQINYPALLELCRTNPTLISNLALKLSGRITRVELQHAIFSQQDATLKVSFFIKQLMNSYATKGVSSHKLRLTMTRADIANHLGLSVETISRVFKKLKDQSIINVDGRDLEVLSTSSLEKLSQL